MLVCLLDGLSRCGSLRACSLGPCAWLEEICSTSISGIPSLRTPASREIISRLKSVSHTSNLWEQTCDCQKYTGFKTKSILSLQDLWQSQSLETVPVCIVVLYFLHDNIAGSHWCDECMKSNELSVCHKLWSIL